MLTRRQFCKLGATAGAGILLPLGLVDKAFAFNLLGQQLPLNPGVLPKFVDRLPIANLMPGAPAGSGVDYIVEAVPNKAIVSSGMAAATAANGFTYTGTSVWSYRPGVSGYQPNLPVGTAPGYGAAPNTYLGPSFVAQKGTPISVKWVNNLKDAAGNPIPHPLPVDPSLHWANPLGYDPGTDPQVTFGLNPATGMQGYIYPVAPGVKGGSTFNYTLTDVPIVPHVHGGEQISYADGGPDQWFTPDGKVGAGYATWDGSAWQTTQPVANANYSVYHYDNAQQGATIWYHDHALGITRLNVYMGLAGAYVIHDAARENAIIAGGIPSIFSGATDKYGQPFDVPVVIQDRMFDLSGQLFLPAVSLNPTAQPFWVPEFFGDTILVNGVVWPYLRVEPKPYRLRLLNGSNARFYTLTFTSSGGKGAGPVGNFFQVATDGGYLGAAAPMSTITIAPGERAEIVFDFSQFAGQTVTVKNTAKAPFPAGRPTDKNTGQIMQFRVDPLAAGAVPVAWAPPPTVNAQLSTYASTGVPTLLLKPPAATTPTPVRTRLLTLKEVMGPGGPLMVTVNYTFWPHKMAGGMTMGQLTETPQQQTAEYWQIVNLTVDAHPIHTHLIDFQLVQRQAFDAKGYVAAWTAAFPGGVMPMEPFGPPLALVADPTAPGGYRLDVAKYNTPLPGVLGPGGTPVIGGNPDVTPFLKGAAVLPPLEERGWKDTIKAYPGEVTTFVARWSSNDSNNVVPFPFDPTQGPGYVWHCHIIDHEDNEMMRPYKVV